MSKRKKDNNRNKDAKKFADKKRLLRLLEKETGEGKLTESEQEELKKLSGDSNIPRTEVSTWEAVARAFNVTVRTVGRWSREGMPKLRNGGYDLIEIQAWKTLRGEKVKENKAQDKEQWDIKYRQMKALLAEIEYKKRIGDLIPKEEVEAGMIYQITAIKMQFLSLPQRLAPQLEGLDVGARAALINDRIQEIIKGFADGQY